MATATAIKKEDPGVTSSRDQRWTEATGRRKEAIARARITPSARMSVVINGKDSNEYFRTDALRTTAVEPFLKLSLPQQFTVTVIVRGGGIAGQATAVRHAISRALNEYAPETRTILKAEGFLKRDPRAKERRKAGFVKARKRKQWSKR